MSKLIYITGLSGAGKTTIGLELQKRIPNSIFLDGDIIRNSMSKDLGFDPVAKLENIRRNNELIRMLYSQGFTVIAAFMASVQEERDKVFDMCLNSTLVQLTTPLDTCIRRDPKGLYAKKLDNFSGTSLPYNTSSHADIYINTAICTVSDAVNIIINDLTKEE
jgi:adenylylsulfate kinase-like enzyme